MFTQCSTIAKDTVCLEAQVKITPDVKIGKPVIKCKGEPFIGRCHGTPQESCSFFVSQRIEVKVPVAFDVDVDAASDGIVCGEPKADDLKEDDGDCGSCK